MIAKAALRALAITGVLAALMLGLAGTVHWPGALLFLAAMAIGGFSMETWLIVNDPALYHERHNTKQKKSRAERILLPLLNVTFFVWLLGMALDVRVSGIWQMPLWVNVVAAAVVLTCFLLNITVFAANHFASSIVRIQDGQQVATAGPYRIVRHPLYGIVVLTYFIIPFALGSWSGLWGVPVLVLVLAIRTVCEEQLLLRDLPGYAEYCAKVRYRFLPLIW